MIKMIKLSCGYRLFTTPIWLDHGLNGCSYMDLNSTFDTNVCINLLEVYNSPLISHIQSFRFLNVSAGVFLTKANLFPTEATRGAQIILVQSQALTCMMCACECWPDFDRTLPCHASCSPASYLHSLRRTLICLRCWPSSVWFMGWLEPWWLGLLGASSGCPINSGTGYLLLVVGEIMVTYVCASYWCFSGLNRICA